MLKVFQRILRNSLWLKSFTTALQLYLALHSWTLTGFDPLFRYARSHWRFKTSSKSDAVEADPQVFLMFLAGARVELFTIIYIP